MSSHDDISHDDVSHVDPSSHSGDSNADAATPGDPASNYVPPQVTPLGTLPASTGMPVSPLTFPEDPQP